MPHSIIDPWVLSSAIFKGFLTTWPLWVLLGIFYCIKQIVFSSKSKKKYGLGKSSANKARNNDYRSPNVCAICGKSVSQKVTQFCLLHEQKFGGKIYCYEHQRG